MKSKILFWRLVLLCGTIFSALAFGRIIQVVTALKISLFMPKWLALLVFFGVTFLLELGLLGLTWNLKFQHSLGKLGELTLPRSWQRALAGLGAILILVGYFWFVLFSPLRGFLMNDPTGKAIVLGQQNGQLKILNTIDGSYALTDNLPLTSALVNSGLQWWCVWLCVLVTGFLLNISRKKSLLSQSTLIALSGFAVINKFFYYLPAINAFPFSQYWSEGSRFYYASLLVSKQVYGMPLAPSFIDIPRDLVTSLPFFLGRPSIFILRLWSNLLLLGTSVFTAFLTSRRARVTDPWLRWLLTAWCCLFIFQLNTIYFHLLLAVMVILLFSSKKNSWLTLVAVVLSSFWVGMDRINWYPVPAMLAITLFLLEENVREYGSLPKYLAKPALWTIAGTSSALLGAFLIIKLSRIDFAAATSSLSSALLWYRLLPNSTFSFGILPAIVCISLPIWIAIAWRMRASNWHPLRTICVCAIPLILFIGGLIASTKIGGGSDLHNLDAYLILLMIVAVYIYAGTFAVETPKIVQPLPWSIALLAFLIPVFLGGQTVRLALPGNPSEMKAELEQLNSLIDPPASQGEVLFVSQRQLITFGYVPGIQLSPDYDMVTLMEMVMSGNRAYLDKFQKDLADHRFSFIIIEPQRMRTESQDKNFSEENNVWVKTITQPFLCNYAPVLQLPLAGVTVYAPKPGSQNCP